MIDSDTTYPYVLVSGSPYEMGVQHGEQCRDRVHQFLDMILFAVVKGKVTKADVLHRTKSFRPSFERLSPNMVEEIRGLADGAGLSFEEAMLLQIRGEIGNVHDGGCTTFVVSGDGTENGKILIGQNSDMSPEQEEVGMILHLVPDKGPRILMWTFGGHLGYHGMNSAGVAHFANALGGGPVWRKGLPHYPIKRVMLEQTTVTEVLAILKNHPVCSSGNYVLTGGCKTIEDIELTPAGFERLGDNKEGFIVHSNHFLCGRFRTEETDAASIQDSFVRYERIRALIKDQFGGINARAMQEILSDHANYPLSICRHLQDSDNVGKTVACLIAEPEAGNFHVSKGNPCENNFVTHVV